MSNLRLNPEGIVGNTWIGNNTDNSWSTRRKTLEAHGRSTTRAPLPGNVTHLIQLCYIFGKRQPVLCHPYVASPYTKSVSSFQNTFIYSFGDLGLLQRSTEIVSSPAKIALPRTGSIAPQYHTSMVGFLHLIQVAMVSQRELANCLPIMSVF